MTTRMKKTNPKAVDRNSTNSTSVVQLSSTYFTKFKLLCSPSQLMFSFEGPIMTSVCLCCFAHRMSQALSQWQ
uniref:Uncharacterized protein n=1 Tax=Anguilla anguilla TaxID=7936 RepID=A0A0E9RF01_ANGAN